MNRRSPSDNPRAATLRAARVFLCLTLTATFAIAEEPPCPEGGTWLDCFNELLQAAQEEGVEKVETAKDDLEAGARENTQKNVEAAASSDDSAAKHDFLTSFLGALGLNGLSQEDGDLRFAYNVPEGSLGGAVAGVGIEVVAREPELYAPLTQALDASEDPMKPQTDELEKELGDFDDVTYRLRVSFFNDSESNGFGQRFTPSYDKVFKELLREVGNEAAELEELVQGTGAGSPGIEFIDVLVEKTPADDRERLQGSFSRAAAAVADRQDRLVARLREVQFDRWGELLSNQPQLYLTGEYRARDAAVLGPDSKKFSLTFETGKANLNGLSKKCQPITVACYTSFVDDIEDKLGISSRWKVELEYEWRDALLLDDIAGIDAIDQPEAESLIGSVTYGRKLPFGSDGDARFDLEIEGEDVSDDPEKQDRVVATATVSRKVGDATLSVGLVWASKPEFLDDVDENLSARAGLRFSFDRQEDEDDDSASQ